MHPKTNKLVTEEELILEYPYEFEIMEKLKKDYKFMQKEDFKDKSIEDYLKENNYNRDLDYILF